MERETGLSKEEKEKVMTSDEKEDEESALNGRVVAVELLSTSLVCLKHALEEINENDIDSRSAQWRCIAAPWTCSK